jgi:predicted metal-dependent hydrolase
MQPGRPIRHEGMSSELPAARCGEPPSPGLIHAIAQFNSREFFECHETLEAIWNAEPGPIRVLYKGILQVGVGCYHLLRRNYRGALMKLQSGADYLEPFAPRCMGVEVARLITDARRLRAALVALGPERFLEVEVDLIPTVYLVPVNGAPEP